MEKQLLEPTRDHTLVSKWNKVQWSLFRAKWSFCANKLTRNISKAKESLAEFLDMRLHMQYGHRLLIGVCSLQVP